MTMDLTTNDYIDQLRDQARQIQNEVLETCARLETDLEESASELSALRRELIFVWPALLITPSIVNLDGQPRRFQRQHLLNRFRDWIRPRRPGNFSLWHGPARLLVVDYQERMFGHMTALMRRIELDTKRAGKNYQIHYSKTANHLKNELTHTLKKFTPSGIKAQQAASFITQARAAAGWMLARPLNTLAFTPETDSDFKPEKRESILQALRLYKKSSDSLRRLGGWLSLNFIARCQLERYKCEFYLHMKPVNLAALNAILGVVQRIAVQTPIPNEAYPIVQEMNLTIKQLSTLK